LPRSGIVSYGKGGRQPSHQLPFCDEVTDALVTRSHATAFTGATAVPNDDLAQHLKRWHPDAATNDPVYPRDA
jgi:hypothetical protein